MFRHDTHTQHIFRTLTTSCYSAVRGSPAILIISFALYSKAVSHTSCTQLLIRTLPCRYRIFLFDQPLPLLFSSFCLCFSFCFPFSSFFRLSWVIEVMLVERDMSHCTTFARETRLIESLLVPSMGYYGWSSKVDNHDAINFQPAVVSLWHRVIVSCGNQNALFESFRKCSQCVC